MPFSERFLAQREGKDVAVADFHYLASCSLHLGLTAEQSAHDPAHGSGSGILVHFILATGNRDALLHRKLNDVGCCPRVSAIGIGGNDTSADVPHPH